MFYFTGHHDNWEVRSRPLFDLCACTMYMRSILTVQLNDRLAIAKFVCKLALILSCGVGVDLRDLQHRVCGLLIRVHGFRGQIVDHVKGVAHLAVKWEEKEHIGVEKQNMVLYSKIKYWMMSHVQTVTLFFINLSKASPFPPVLVSQLSQSHKAIMSKEFAPIFFYATGYYRSQIPTHFAWSYNMFSSSKYHTASLEVDIGYDMDFHFSDSNNAVTPHLIYPLCAQWHIRPWRSANHSWK